MRGLVATIVLVVIALFVGDRVAVVLAQHEIGRRVAEENHLAQQPRVDITGFPFLTQALDGHYREIGIRVGDWSDKDITVHDLDITLTDVTAPLNDLIHQRTSNLVAEKATATALVPYDVIVKYAPTGVRSITKGPKGLRVTGTFTIEGVQVPGTMDVTVAPTPTGFEVTPVSIQAEAGGPEVSLDLLRQWLTFTVPLQQLPLGAHLTAIQPGPDGVHVTAVANNAHFSDLS